LILIIAIHSRHRLIHNVRMMLYLLLLYLLLLISLKDRW